MSDIAHDLSHMLSLSIAENAKLKAEIERLCTVADAARELRDARRRYIRVSFDVEEAGYSVKWMEASTAELQAEDRLDAALEALAKVGS